MRDVIRRVEVECPYCGHKNIDVIDSEGQTLLTCDVEYGGCDETFAVKYEFSVSVKVFRLELVYDDSHCWFCKGLRPVDDSIPCPNCDKPGNPFDQDKFNDKKG